jgi:transposase
MDEIAKRKGHKNYVTVLSNLDKGELIEVIDSHEQTEIIESLMKQPLEVREKVEEVSVDMWGGFPEIIKQVFPKAKIVTDRFHVMKAVNKELDEIRKQTKFKSKIKGAKWLLLKNKEDLDEEQLKDLESVLKQSKRLRQAYEFKESFRAIYEDPKGSEEGKIAILDWLKNAHKVYSSVIGTIRNHLDYS